MRIPPGPGSSALRDGSAKQWVVIKRCRKKAKLMGMTAPLIGRLRYKARLLKSCLVYKNK